MSCLRMSTIGCPEHQIDDYQRTEIDLTKAPAPNGVPRTEDNTYAIYAINSVFAEPTRRKYRRWLVAGPQWPDAKSEQDITDSVSTDDHYRDVKKRIMCNGPVSRHSRPGDHVIVMVMLYMIDNESNHIGGIPSWRYSDFRAAYRP